MPTITKISYDINLDESPYTFREDSDRKSNFWNKYINDFQDMDGVLAAIKSHIFLDRIPAPYNSSEAKKVSYAIATTFHPTNSAIKKEMLEALFEEFKVDKRLDYHLDPHGNSIIHLLYNGEEIKYFAEKYKLDPNIKNILGNNPFEHYLHKHLFGAAEISINIGSKISRTLKEEVIKGLEEYLDLDAMSDMRYQIILNILFHKKILSEDLFPENILQYIDNSKVFLDLEASRSGTYRCLSKFKQNYFQDISWVKNHLSDLADHLIKHISLEGLTGFSAEEQFIKNYSDISHYLNNLMMQENALLKATPLSYFNEDISVYRGMKIHSLDQVDQWFKYGYESYSCQDYVPNRVWIGYNYREKSLEPTPLNCGSDCPSYTGNGQKAGVTYTSTAAWAVSRFSKGQYSLRDSKIKIIQEFKVSAQDIHLEPYNYECSIHLPSVKPENILAIYIMDIDNNIQATHVNPYIAEQALHFSEDRINKAEIKNCPHFDKIITIPSGSTIAEYRSFIAGLDAAHHDEL